jgi:hypothetical protein
LNRLSRHPAIAGETWRQARAGNARFFALAQTARLKASPEIDLAQIVCAIPD